MAFDEPNPLPQVPGQLQEAVPAPPVPPRPLAAHNSREQSFVLFHNTTPRYVNLYWIDYNGRRSFYAILRPGANIKANTYVTHPWLFRDSQTGEYMQVQKQEVYWPQIYKIAHPINAGQWIVGRRKIDIHLPVDLLSNRCLWTVAQRIKSDCEGRVILDELPMPATLIKELKQILNRIRHFESGGGIWIQGRIGR